MALGMLVPFEAAVEIKKQHFAEVPQLLLAVQFGILSREAQYILKSMLVHYLSVLDLVPVQVLHNFPLY